VLFATLAANPGTKLLVASGHLGVSVFVEKLPEFFKVLFPAVVTKIPGET
jgi:hypothetical protein